MQNPEFLAKFLNQFHSAILQSVFERFQATFSIEDLEQVIRALFVENCFTKTKALNVLYSLSQIRPFALYFSAVDEGLRTQVFSFCEDMERRAGELTDAQRERLGALRAAWV